MIDILFIQKRISALPAVLREETTPLVFPLRTAVNAVKRLYYIDMRKVRQVILLLWQPENLADKLCNGISNLFRLEPI